ncbi:FCD domain-containing protein [Paracoccus sp. (in: a-proteobacteria)]|uniref:FCD domain-containing protein n=1 Tax=Paracoccus sp. TaxID=267 RepID=UPI0026DFF09B|nr:FCD domain-containing protein [Paracoccus sp. (in: a-proteobacteria)]MDO5646325.1 FCD domain-containing protein [Paracoccus sp. (in: a-proteobacteria)]
MSDSKPNKPGRAATTVITHIESLILEGSLRPGEPLLPERELAARLNVSRPTLRDALKSLEERGLLTSKEGKGMKVAQIGAQSITDPLIAMLSERGEVADDYLEFRDVVESSAAAMAAQRANEPEIQRIKDCVARIQKAHTANDPAAEADADADLHIAIYEASHNLVILQIMRALSGNLRTDVLHNRQRLFTIPYVRDLLRDQHLAIAQAIIDRRPGDARSAAHEHLSYLRRATREFREAEAKLDMSLRRLDSGGLSALKG